MSKYYYKGFTNALWSINIDAYNFLKNLEKQPDASDENAGVLSKAYSEFQKFEDFYNGIDFDNLHREEFYPLFIARDLLPAYKEQMDNVFKGRFQSDLLHLERAGSAICDVGHIYRTNLKKIFNEIQSFPGEENFKIRIFDCDGREWMLPYCI
ncbi:MAG: hypothetical protein Q8O89_08555 [Nanoarchaeota archaeon]|nr:hypothetical protein [Nanoarchaeota archaeon]